MKVTELSTDQLSELKSNLFYNYTDEPVEITWDAADRIESCQYYDDIPDELVFELYSGIDFVSDDFACSSWNH